MESSYEDLYDDFCENCQFSMNDCDCFQYTEQQKLIKIQTVNQIFNKLMADCQTLQQTLNLNQDEVMNLMDQFKWNQEIILNNYYDCELEEKRLIKESQQKQKKQQQLLINTNENECRICLEPQKSFIVQQDCGHQSCPDCFKQYLQSQLSSHRYGLMKCFECNIKIKYSVCLQHLSSEETNQLMKIIAQTYILLKKKIKFCPGIDCIYAIENDDYLTTEVECNCGLVFCFNCLESNHLPASCKQVKEWNIKSENESQNIAWININTKICPKCQQAIEKNQGCNHMSCTQCKHQFCWICLREWNSDHGSYYKCNSVKDEQQITDKKSTAYLHKLYLHYYERNQNHTKSQKSIDALQINLNKQITLLHGRQMVNLSEMEFIKISCQVLRESRRTLRWSYAQGYYQKIQGHQQIQMFEFNQSQSESRCDRLHELLEKDLYQIIHDSDMTNFQKIKQEIVNLTAFTEQFTSKFVRESSEQK